MKMKVKLLILFVVDLVGGSKYSLSQAAGAIINGEFTDINIPISVLKLYSDSGSRRVDMNTILTDTLFELPEENRMSQVFEIGGMNFDWLNRFYNLILVDSLEAFAQFEAKFTIEMFDFTGFYLVLWTGDYEPGSLQRFNAIFELFWSRRVSNVNLLVQSGENVFVYTFFMYHPSGCERLVLVQSNTFRNGKFLEPGVIYPDKFRNFFGCPLWVATYNIPPALWILPNGHVQGIEGTLLKTIAEYLNFTIRAKMNSELRGQLFSNGSGTGVFRTLREQKANFSIGFMFQSSENLKAYVGFTNPHMITQLVMVIPEHDNSDIFTPFLLPLDFTVWYMILVVFALLVGSRLLLHKIVSTSTREFIYGRTKKYLLDLINVFLGGAGYFPRRNFARTLVILFVVYAFVLRSAYQGVIFTFLTNNVQVEKLKTIDDLIERNYTLWVTDTGVQYIESMSKLVSR